MAQGSDSVYINGQPAARVGDRTVCDAKISAGSPNVCIGGGTATTDAIDPEVPVWLERSVMALGLASAFALASPVLVMAGLAGGIAGHWAGGELFGEGSDGQKLMAFGGALLGGGIGAKGGKAFDARYEFKSQRFGSNLDNVKLVKKPVLLVPMKKITEMEIFSRLTFEGQVKVLKYEPNLQGLSEVANTSKGAKSFTEWELYKKGGISVGPAFRSAMIDKAAKLEPELQQYINGLLLGY